MLQNIRNKTQGWITRVIVGLVCAAFILWGIHSFSQWTGGSDNSVASVNGRDIMPSAFNTAYQRLQQQQQIQLGANFKLTESMQAMLKQAALQQLIASTALLQAAEKRGLRFTPVQVGHVISGISAFQENGHFSSIKFEQTLASLGYSENEFFDNIQNAMLINQLRVGIVASNFALPWESNEIVQLVNQKRDIAYTVIPLNSFAEKSLVSEDELKQYYHAHQDQFTTPQTLILQYVELSLPDYAKQHHLHDSEKASQAFADAVDKLNNLAYTNSQSLAPAAKELGLTLQTSEPISQKLHAKGIFANETIKQGAFSKDVLAGNNSNLINLDDQHVVVFRVLSQRPSQLKSFDQVKNQIVSQLKDQKMQLLASNAAQNMVSQVLAGKSLMAVATDQHKTMIRQTNISRYTSGPNGAIYHAAFQLPRPSKQSSVGMFHLPSGDFAVIQVVKASSTNDQKMRPIQTRVVDQQIASAYAQLEYQLYVNEVLSDSRIHINGMKN